MPHSRDYVQVKRCAGNAFYLFPNFVKIITVYYKQSISISILKVLSFTDISEGVKSSVVV